MTVPVDFGYRHQWADDRHAPQRSGEELEEDGCENTATLSMHTSARTAGPVGAVERGFILRTRYVLDEVIGRGGTSVVFRARDLHRASSEDADGDLVAVKLMRDEWRGDALAVERLQREFRQMQTLAHPAIVRVFDLDCDDEVWFMTMELVTGRTVKTWMKQSPDRAESLRVIEACGSALEHAHASGFLHGDLKPTNVMLADDGTVKLIDFGSASTLGSRVVTSSMPTLAATALYASPQILAGKAGEVRDDVFSLACLSYAILSGGRHPFGRRPSLEDGRAKSAPHRVNAIHPKLFAVIERGLSAERAERQASAAEFLGELMEAESRAQLDTTRSNAILVRSGLEPAPEGELQLPARRMPAQRMPAQRKTWSTIGMALLIVPIVSTVMLFLPDLRRVVAGPSSAGSAKATPTASPAAAEAGAVPEQVGNAAQPPRDIGVISFSASTVHASAMQPLVAVAVERLRGTRSAGAFVWRLEGGTAYPGVDFQKLQPQLARFQEGQTVRTLFIPLMNTRTAQLNDRPRTFTVALQPVAGGPTLGRYDRVIVTIDPPVSSAHPALYQVLAEQ